MRRAVRGAVGRVGLAAIIAVFLAACGSSAPAQRSSPIGTAAGRGEAPASATPGTGKAAVSASARELPASPPSATRRTMEVDEKSGGELASLGPPVPPRATELVGLAPAAVTAYLGRPGFKRRDDPAEIWRYAAASCFLDLFLYKRGDGFAVTHVEARGKSIVKVSADDCLRDLFKTR